MDFITGVFATIGAFFVFGTLWFWVISTVLFGWLIYLTEEDSHFFAGLLVVAFVWTMSSVNDISLIANPLLWAKWVAVYLAVGTLWSVLKWVSFLFKQKDILKKERDAFVKIKKTELVNGKISDDDWPRFSKWLKDNNYRPNDSYEDFDERTDVVPTVKGRFGDLTAWIIWWPFSAFWTILNDPLRRVARLIVQALKGVYTRTANSIFSSEV